MKVCIDDLLTVDCEGFLNGGEKWNGFEQPLFNAEQLATIEKWWIENDNGVHNGDTWRDQYTDIGHGFYVVEGWVWEMHPDFALCDDCGDSIYWSDPQGKWLHEDTESDCFLSSSCVMGNGNTMKRKATR